MRARDFRRRVHGLVLVSTFAAACGCSAAGTQTPLPGPCQAAPLDDVLYAGLLSPAKGSVTGSAIVARLCDGGASAYISRSTPTTVPPNQLLMNISSYTTDSTRDFDITRPTDATSLQFGISLGLDAAQPGTATSIDRCQAIQVCAILPVPSSLQCPSFTNSDACPQGCDFRGANSCVPIEPATCYNACYGDKTGSWHLNLSSVERFTAPDGGVPDQDLFVAHGTFEATLVADTSSGAAPGSTETLSLNF